MHKQIYNYCRADLNKMKRAVFYLILVLVAFVAHYNKAMECGLDNKRHQKQLKKIAMNCQRILKRKSTDESNEDSSSYDSDEGSIEVTPTPRQLRTNRRLAEQRSGTFNTRNERPNLDSNSRCVVLCVFKQLGMIGNNDLPDYSMVSRVLVQDHQSRELRDFISDTIGECFQFLEREIEPDPCIQSKVLINCLADRGRLNCADWPVGNIPFYS